MKKLYALLILSLFTFTTQAQVVISQIYGGGGNTGAPFTHDFVELFNTTSSPIDISGWTLQYASATGSSWSRNTLPAGTIINANSYFLIQLAAGSGNGVALPTPNHIFTSSPLALSGTAGKLGLTNSDTILSGTNPIGAANLIDFVGFGSTANAFEGTGPTPAPSNTTSIFRLNGGCTDTNNNNADFVTGAPSPRNSSSPINVCSNAPSLVISSPSNNAIFNPETTSVNIAISVSNFVVGNPGAGIDGHIHYSVNGGTTVMKYDTTPITLSGLTPGNYSIAMQLVDNNHNALNPTVNANVNFTIASYIVVNNIAEMRQDVSGNGLGRYYQINSNPVITYTRTNRNQKYIQDASAAVLIDDNTPAPGIITTPMVIGDAIAGLKGFTTSFLGGLQFTPLTNATVASSGNTVTPQVVTINELNSNLDAYESELVRVNNLTFTDAGSTFAVNTNYNVTNNSETLVFRTLFGEANYITQTIPSGEQDIVAIVARNNALAQIVARNLSDITLDVTSFDAISGLKMYPNPAKNGQTLFITSDSSVEKNVAIYNVLGRKVLEATTQQNTINTNGLTTGVYMVKITEEGKTSTRKLVIQ